MMPFGALTPILIHLLLLTYKTNAFTKRGLALKAGEKIKDMMQGAKQAVIDSLTPARAGSEGRTSPFPGWRSTAARSSPSQKTKKLTRMKGGRFNFLGIADESRSGDGLSSLSRASSSSSIDLDFFRAPMFTEESFYLDPKGQSLSKNQQQLEKDYKRARKAVDKAGKVLENLNEEDALRQDAGVNFMIQEFQKEWLEKIHPDNRNNLRLGKEMEEVGNSLKQILRFSRERTKAGESVSRITNEWKIFQKEHVRALEEALHLHINVEVEKIIHSKLEEIRVNWKPGTVVESTLNDFQKQFSPLELQQIDRLIAPYFSGSISQAKPGAGLKTFLEEKLARIPQESNPEFQFILKEILRKNLYNILQEPNGELLKFSSEDLAQAVLVGDPKSIVDLKMRFWVSKIFKPVDDVAKTRLTNEFNHLIDGVIRNDDLMKSAYKERVEDLLYSGDPKVEAQLFKKYFGIEKSSRHIYENLKEMENVWAVDFQAFEKYFKDKLPVGDYSDLFKAAKESRPKYVKVLNSIKDKRMITTYEKIVAEVNEMGLKSRRSWLQRFLEKMKENGLLTDISFSTLSKGASGSSLDPDKSMNTVRKMMKVDLYRSLEVEKVPQLARGPLQDSIFTSLSTIFEAGLLTEEEFKALVPAPSLKELSTAWTQQFFKMWGEMSQLPESFKERLITRAMGRLSEINRDENLSAENVRNLRNGLEEYHQSQFEGYIKNKNYADAWKMLLPASIKKTAMESNSENYIAKALWYDYFSRELPAFRVQEFQTLRGKLLKMKKPDVKDGDQLVESVLSILEKGQTKSGRKPAISNEKGSLDPDFYSGASTSTIPQKSFKKPGKESEVDKFMDDLLDKRNLVLWEKPLQFQDERLMNSPFKYLNQDLIRKWNSGVEFMKKNSANLYEKKEIELMRSKKLDRALESKKEYQELIGNLLELVLQRYEPSQVSRDLYKLKRVDNDIFDPEDFSYH